MTRHVEFLEEVIEPFLQECRWHCCLAESFLRLSKNIQTSGFLQLKGDCVLRYGFLEGFEEEILVVIEEGFLEFGLALVGVNHCWW